MNQQPISYIISSKPNQFDAVMICEGVQEADEETRIEAWQQIIDSGLVWKLQGFFGRTAQNLIDAGLCQRPAASEVSL